MDNELENKIDAIVNQNLTDFADAFIHGLSQTKQLYSLVEDVAVKFSIWSDKNEWATKRKDAFNHFINNIYGKQ